MSEDSKRVARTIYLSPKLEKEIEELRSPEKMDRPSFTNMTEYLIKEGIKSVKRLRKS